MYNSRKNTTGCVACGIKRKKREKEEKEPVNTMDYMDCLANVFKKEEPKRETFVGIIIRKITSWRKRIDGGKSKQN